MEWLQRTVALLLIVSQLASSLSLRDTSVLGLVHPEDDEGQLETVAGLILRHFPSIQEVLAPGTKEISTPCRQHVELYMKELTAFKTWALKMFDASTKVPESILGGNFINLGNFDQCLAVRGLDDIGTPVFTGQYCRSGVLVDVPGSNISLRFEWVVCTPSTCSPTDLEEVLRERLPPLMGVLGLNVQVTLNPDNCYTGYDQPPLSAGAGVMMTVFTGLLILVIVGTICNVRWPKKENMQFLFAFSVIENVREMLSTRSPPNTMACLYGLRFLSLCWIMLGHRYVMATAVPIINFTKIPQMLPEVGMSLILNALVGVDTFFFMSGFLMAHSFLKDMSKVGRFKPLQFYLYRYLRLTTTLALVVGYYATLMAHTGYGPVWRTALNSPTEVCRKYWYLTLTYLNNYVHLDPTQHNLCVDQAWYLTVDMQLAWFSPLLLLPLWRWPRWTSQVLPLLIIASCFAPFTITYINNYPMHTDLRSNPVTTDRMLVELYWAAYMRTTPYLIGICLAYFLHQERFKVKLTTWMVTLGWMVSTATCLTVVLALSIMYDPAHNYNRTEAAFYSGFHRLGWSLSLAWIVFACVKGHGGLVNQILSWRVFIPMSRLTYCMFLTHFIVLYYHVGNLRTITFFDHFNTVHKFLGDLVMTTGLALILHLLCEAPTLKLLRIVFSKGKKKQKEEEADEQEQ